MAKIYPLREVIRDLQQLVDVMSTQKALAQAIGVSGQYLSDVLRGKREPGEAVLRFLGYEKIVGYRYVGRDKTMKKFLSDLKEDIHDSTDR